MVPITLLIPYALQTIDNIIIYTMFQIVKKKKHNEDEEEENGRGDAEDRKVKRWKNSNQTISSVLNVVEDEQHTTDEKKKKR